MNYYTEGSGECVLECSPSDYKKLERLLEKSDENEEEGASFLSLDYTEPKDKSPGQLYLYGEDSFRPDLLSGPFIKAFGKLLKKNKKKTYCMGLSYNADRLVANICGGDRVVFYDVGYMQHESNINNGNLDTRVVVRLLAGLLGATSNKLTVPEADVVCRTIRKLGWNGPKLPEDNSYDV